MYYDPDFIEYGAPLYCPQGWRCPRCNSILSPNMSFCPFCSCGNQRTTVSPTTTPIVNDTDWWEEYLRQSTTTGGSAFDKKFVTTASSADFIGDIEFTPSGAILYHGEMPSITL